MVDSHTVQALRPHPARTSPSPTVLDLGTPFPPDLATRAQRIAGRPLTVGGLVAWFAGLLPQASWYACDAQADGDDGAGLSLALRARVGGIRVIRIGLGLYRHADGALELHLFAGHVARSHRRRGISARGERLASVLAATLAPHPNTRLTLVAGGEASDDGVLERTGVWLHAKRGYAFTDESGHPSAFWGEARPVEGRASQVDVFRHRFIAWTHDAVARGRGAALTAPEAERLRAMAEGCRAPEDFLRLRGWPGVCAQADRLGEAFLRSPMAPEWHGTRLVCCAPRDVS